MESVDARRKSNDKSQPLRKQPVAIQPETHIRANSRSKEEQLMLRKKMMKYNPLEASGMKKKTATQAAIADAKKESASPINDFEHQGSNGDKVKLPNPELLSRLAKGERAQVNKDDMKQLTTKNYNNLPEVKKRREDQERKDDIKRRAEKQKNFGKELRARSKSKGNSEHEG